MIAVILSSKFIEGTLMAQFGKILPIELPLKNKRILSYQLEWLKKNKFEKIYLTIPKGYNIEIPENIIKIEIEESLSLISVFSIISSKFDIGEKIFINYGDTVFLKSGGIDFSKNYFFIQNPKIHYSWGKSINQKDVPVGGVFIENKILNDFLKTSYNLDDLFTKIYSSKEITLFNNFTWLDFGHTLTFYNSRKNYLESRSFNSLSIKEGFLIKKSKDILKIWSEYKWLEYFKNKYPNNFPFVKNFEIKNQKAQYFIEYCNHPTLSEILVFGKLDESYFFKILEKLKITLIKLNHTKTNIKAPKEKKFMIKKLLKRRNQIEKVTNELHGDINFVKNKIEENIEYYNKRTSKSIISHGDLCFSNILFDFSNFEPILIDPRGYFHEEDGFTIYGTDSYDLYKIAQSYIIGYDFFISDNIDKTFFSKEGIEKRFYLFCTLFEIDELDLKMGLNNLFLTMIPLHNNSKKRQKYFLSALDLINKL